MDGPAQGRGGGHGQLRGFLRPQIRPEQDRKPKALAGRRNPLPPQPSPAPGLRFGEDHHAFLHAVAGEFLDHVIGGSGLLEHPDVAADDLVAPRRASRSSACSTSGALQQPVAEVRAGLDVVAQRAQFLDARPDRRAADAELLRKFRAGDGAVLPARAGPKGFRRRVSCIHCSERLRSPCSICSRARVLRRRDDVIRVIAGQS